LKIKADQKLGVKVVMRAMEEPLRQIANKKPARELLGTMPKPTRWIS
jgi:hypothetical protein